MSEEYQAGLTELRLNAKSAIEGINQLAKRIEACDKQIALHEAAISNMQMIISEQTNIINELRAMLYNSGIR